MRISDWSSDVCSSDLLLHPGAIAGTGFTAAHPLLDQVAEMSGFPEFFGNFLSIAVLLICWLLVVLAFFIRSEEHTSELQSLMRISYAVFCLKKKRTYIIRKQQ